MQLVRYEAARQALQECHTIDEAKEIRDKAEALRAYAKQAQDKDLEIWTAEIKLRAQRKLGALSQGLEKAKGATEPGTNRGKSRLPSGGKTSKAVTLKAAGVSTSTANRCEQLADIQPDVFEAEIAKAKDKGQAPTAQSIGKTVLQKKNRKKKTEQLAEAGKIEGRYSVIYADPPWQYEHVKTQSRAIENQYPTMDLSAICALPVARLATNDAILFLWTTAPKLEEAFSVLKAWGFTYRTCAVWDKQKIGMGYYFRVQHELLLVATRGKIPAPEESARPSSVIVSKRGRHSEKPDSVYELIEAMYPELHRIELFARNKREGWESWGNESTTSKSD